MKQISYPVLITCSGLDPFVLGKEIGHYLITGVH